MKITRTYPKFTEVCILLDVWLKAFVAPPTITKTQHDFGTNYNVEDPISNTSFETVLFTLTAERNGAAVTVIHEGVAKAANEIPLNVHPVDTKWAELFYVGPAQACVCKAKVVFRKPNYEDIIVREWTVRFI